jgi:hypothetical protein
MMLDDYLGNKDNFPILDYKTYEEIAEIAAEHLEFPISPSTVRGIRNQKIECGFDVWKAPLRKAKLNHSEKLNILAAEMAGFKKQITEQDRKFKIIFEKLHALDPNQNVQEDFKFNNGGGDGTDLAL